MVVVVNIIPIKRSTLPVRVRPESDANITTAPFRFQVAHRVDQKALPDDDFDNYHDYHDVVCMIGSCLSCGQSESFKHLIWPCGSISNLIMIMMIITTKMIIIATEMMIITTNLM